MTVNRSLEAIAQRIEQEIESLKAKNVHRYKDGDNIKFELQKEVISNSDIKIKILYLLKKISRPISYHEIAEHLSKDSPDHDFDSILKELDQLEKKGDIIGQVAAGKLYFQIKN